MPDHVYYVSEVVGSSTEGIDPAIRNAIGRASKTVQNLDWFEVTQIRGNIQDGGVGYFQVTLKLGFRLNEP